MKANLSATDVLSKQVDDFVKTLSIPNKKRKIPRPDEDYAYIHSFFSRVITDRNKRANTIDSPEFSEATKTAKRLLPYPTYLENCMDGRLFGPLIGLYGHIGDVLSVAGGILYEFVRDEDQQLTLSPQSNFAQLLKKYLNQSHTKSISLVIDSHVGCAARGAEEAARGKFPNDNGLLTDVLHKLEMTDAVKEFVMTTYKGEKRIFPMNISTDPKDGFLYMGLAQEPALEYAIQEEGYTEEVLKTLTEKGQIISARQISQELNVKSVFEKHIFFIDITHNYGETAVQIWKHIDEMKNELLPVIIKKIEKVYPKLKDNNRRKKELEERALVILVNAYTGFLHKKYYTAYPYAEHHEEGVFVSKGNNPPYEISMFGESSIDMRNLPSNINLASSIVRNNRKNDRVVDETGIFNQADEFVSAPVGVVMQVKVLDVLPNKDWDKFSQLNWYDIKQIPWDTMSENAFMNYLEDKAGTMPVCVANAINKLRQRMGILYDIDEAISTRLIDHDIIVLPIISDVSKRVRFIVPFIKTGF